MDYIHVVNGDPAARLLADVLAGVGRKDRIVVLRDDLALGPLRAIDDASTARIAFWQRALGAGEHGIAQTVVDAFDANAAMLHDLAAEDTTEVVLWHAQNASDQLMLRRIAYHLRNTPQRLNEIGLPTRSIACSARHQENTGNPCTPAALAERLHAIAPISLLRISRLALEWQELKQLDYEMRRWRDNTFKSATFNDVDAMILELATTEWQLCLTVADRIRSVDAGSVVSDILLAWRVRELALHGKIVLEGDPILEKTARLRINRH
jgi:hypothetical protein